MKNIHVPRKFFIALFIFAIAMMLIGLFAGCACPGPNDTVNEVVKEHAYFTVNGYMNEITIYKFEYNGHQYINFVTGGYDNQTIVHDPDCPSHKK
jgi:hypothetical protein